MTRFSEADNMRLVEVTNNADLGTEFGVTN
jgi:hypothetical protein